jgi:hypothetical protein
MKPVNRLPSAATSVAMLLLVSSCASGGVKWRPSLASHVPDSTWVRFAGHSGDSAIMGRAIDWQRGRLRVITAGGDTVAVPHGSTLEVRLNEKAGHTTAGIIAGWALGVTVSYATCPPPKKYCGEQDPTPALAAGLGALIGSRVKTDQWVRVRWDVP